MFLPIYIGESLQSSEKMLHLDPPFIPLQTVFELINKLRKILVNYQCTSAYSPKCGSSIERPHTRFVIAHSNTEMVVNWIWEMLDCFELSSNRIVIKEESGESVKQSDGDSYSLKGTIAGYFENIKSKEYYAMTAKHILSTAKSYVIQKGQNKLGIIKREPIHEFDDIAVYGINFAGSNILDIENSKINLKIGSFEEVMSESICYKYGAFTNKKVSMNVHLFGFCGDIYLGGVDKPPTTVFDFHIGQGNVGDSMGGDSGGPWFIKTKDTYKIIGVHRATVEYLWMR